MVDGNIDVETLRQAMQGNRESLWVFGYASLIWKPGFSYKNRVVGFVSGFKRRFFQGTTTHRGTVSWPGRVGTLLPAEEDDVVWGVAYEVKGIDEIRLALEHLAEREMITGGYYFAATTFNPSSGAEPFEIQVYIADCSNKQYLGDCRLELQAYQIYRARGVCGSNIEYVRKVADFMRTEVPFGMAEDAYLWRLESLIQKFQSGELHLDESDLAQLPICVPEARVDREWAAIKRRESESSMDDVMGCAVVGEVNDEVMDGHSVSSLTDGVGA